MYVEGLQNNCLHSAPHNLIAALDIIQINIINDKFYVIYIRHSGCLKFQLAPVVVFFKTINSAMISDLKFKWFPSWTQ